MAAVDLDHDKGVYIITLNRPEAGNSVSTEVASMLHFVLDEVESDSNARCLIITGSGPRFFCTGGDVKEYATFESRQQLDKVFLKMQDFCHRLSTLSIPVIAAADGMVLGGGAELVLACDLRVISSSATIQFPQVRLGLVTGWGGLWRLVRTVGEPRALDILLTGRTLTAMEALQLGLVHYIADPAIDKAREIALSFDRAAPQAVRWMKHLVRRASLSGYEQAMAEANEVFFELWFSDDHREAERAFLEGREPRFTGK